MSMNVSGMQAAIEAALENEFGAPITEDFQLKFARAVATAVVEYIQANAEVPSGIAVSVSTSTGLGSTTADGTVQ